MAPAAPCGSWRVARTAQAGRLPFRARTLHLIDIENLAGTGIPCEWEVAGIRDAYTVRVGIGPMDQVIVASNHKALPAAGYGWPGARYLVRSGPNGADLELLAVIEHENVATRFSRVNIASGDGAFTLSAAWLAAAGCQVTVVTGAGTLATSLRLAAQHLIRLDATEIGTAQLQPRPDAA